MRAISRRQFVAAAGAGVACTMGGRSSFAGPGNKSQTGLFYSPLSLQHPTVGADYAQRVAWIHNRLQASGLIDELTPIQPLSGEDTRTQALRVHPASTLELLDKCSGAGPAALLAISGVLGAVKAVGQGTTKNAFCAIRPPGHHAYDNPNNDGTCQGQGFCFLNNAGIAARYAQRVLGFGKILIVDWDYHHGNGTESAFYNDPSVFFFSTHNRNAYPGTGDPARRGSGPGQGFNLNVHLPCGTTDDDICSAFENQLLPAMKEVNFTPDFILISAGFDSKANDALGCFDVTPRGFSRLTRLMMDLADTACEGRIVSLLEGGYEDSDSRNSWKGLACCVESHVATLLDGAIHTGGDCLSTSVRHGFRAGPAARRAQVAVPEGTRRITLGTFDGRIIRSIHQTRNRTDLDLRNVPAGRYALTFIGGNGGVIGRELMVLE